MGTVEDLEKSLRNCCSYHQINSKFGWNGLGIEQTSIARRFVSVEQTKLVSGLHKRQKARFLELLLSIIFIKGWLQIF
jgi:hypothetical protein